MISRKKNIFIIIAAILFSGVFLFFVYIYKPPLYFLEDKELNTAEKCFREIELISDEELINKFNDLFIGRFSRDEEEKLFLMLGDYLGCRIKSDFINFKPKNAQDLIGKINLEIQLKNRLLEIISFSADRVPFRNKLIFYDIGYLCPDSKENSLVVQECINLPVIEKVSEKYDQEELRLACQDFCRDLMRYESDPSVFLKEQEELKVLTRYKMADTLKMFWAVRFGGWDFALREADKFSDSEGRVAWRNNLVFARKNFEKHFRSSQVICSEKLNELKKSFCGWTR